MNAEGYVVTEEPGLSIRGRDISGFVEVAKLNWVERSMEVLFKKKLRASQPENALRKLSKKLVPLSLKPRPGVTSPSNPSYSGSFRLMRYNCRERKAQFVLVGSLARSPGHM